MLGTPQTLAHACLTHTYKYIYNPKWFAKENIGIILIIQFTFRLMKNATYAENCLWDIYFYVSEIKGLRISISYAVQFFIGPKQSFYKI